MPRKTDGRKADASRTRSSFNEAAARCHGKRPRRREDDPDGGRASMRPRPDATENFGFGKEAVPPLRASMRPRPDATENETVEGVRGRVRLLQ